MNENDLKDYHQIRSGGAGYIQLPRGLIAVWGNEAVQFLDGLITNDMKTLADGEQMLAAFPNAKGRLLAVVRVLRLGERFFIETEQATRDTLFQNLFRFTFAGDFFIEDLSHERVYFEVLGRPQNAFQAMAAEQTPTAMPYSSPLGVSYLVPAADAGRFRDLLVSENGIRQISPELFEVLRIESGMPKYGVDMDENTIVPELGFEEMISYTKGCYIGQEIIARIHFRGHVAKRLMGIMSEPGAADAGLEPNADLTTEDGKNAGRITSVTYSPKLGTEIALAFVRYDYLEPGTPLVAGGATVSVMELPFVDLR
jgi:folate-binding protein YgfZ